MTDYRQQAIEDVQRAIEDVAAEFLLSATYIAHCLVDPYGRDDERIAYTVAQREARLRLEEALEKIIAMNRMHAKDQYGDAEKAESWSCVTVARAALNAVQEG